MNSIDPELLKLPVLSIRPPWWFWILYSTKRHENRNWSEWYCTKELEKLRPSRGHFLIHGSKGCSPEEFAEACETAASCGATEFPDFDRIPRGGIVGRAILIDVVTYSDSPWFGGPIALVLDEVQEVPFYPCRGELGLFYLPQAA